MTFSLRFFPVFETRGEKYFSLPSLNECPYTDNDPKQDDYDGKNLVVSETFKQFKSNLKTNRAQNFEE